MNPLRTGIHALALLAGLGVAASPALGANASFSGTLTTFTGTGSGAASSAVVAGAGTAGYDVSSFAFTLPSAVFTTSRTTPVGFTPNAPQQAFYTIRQIVSQSNGAGSFAPGGGFAGVMDIGLDVTQELGIVPLTLVLASLPFSIPAGTPRTATGMAAFSANIVTASVVGTGWTTGAITASDQTASAPSATVASTFFAAGTHSLNASGGQITLVTPFLIRVRGASLDNRAGYSVLNLQFSNVPEPGTLLLIGLGAAALGGQGRRQRRR